MNWFKQISHMNAKQKLALKRKWKATYTHPLFVFAVAFLSLIALHMAYAAV